MTYPVLDLLENKPAQQARPESDFDNALSIDVQGVGQSKTTGYPVLDLLDKVGEERTKQTQPQVQPQVQSKQSTNPTQKQSVQQQNQPTRPATLLDEFISPTQSMIDTAGHAVKTANYWLYRPFVGADKAAELSETSTNPFEETRKLFQGKNYQAPKAKPEAQTVLKGVENTLGEVAEKYIVKPGAKALGIPESDIAYGLSGLAYASPFVKPLKNVVVDTSKNISKSFKSKGIKDKGDAAYVPPNDIDPYGKFEFSKTEVPPSEQALRSEILNKVGLPEARKSSIIGNREESSIEYQHSQAKGDPGASILGKQFAEENEALHNFGKDFVKSTGDKIGLDEVSNDTRGKKIVNGIENLLELEKQAYTKGYIEAEKLIGPEQVIDQSSIVDLLGKTSKWTYPETRRGLRKSIYGWMQENNWLIRDEKGDIVRDFNGSPIIRPVSVAEAHNFRKWLNDIWRYEDTKIIGEVKGLNDLNVQNAVGKDVFAEPRKMRKEFAEIFEDPTGIARLLQKDPLTPINRKVPFDNVGKELEKLSPDQFNHIIDTLENAKTKYPALKEDLTNTLNAIRGHYANKIYEKGVGRGEKWNAKAVNDFLEANNNALKIFEKDPKAFDKLVTLKNAGEILDYDPKYVGAEAQKTILKRRGIQEPGLISTGIKKAIKSGAAYTTGSLLGYPEIGAAAAGAIFAQQAERASTKQSVKSANKSLWETSQRPSKQKTSPQQDFASFVKKEPTLGDISKIKPEKKPPESEGGTGGTPPPKPPPKTPPSSSGAAQAQPKAEVKSSVPLNEIGKTKVEKKGTELDLESKLPAEQQQKLNELKEFSKAMDAYVATWNERRQKGNSFLVYDSFSDAPKELKEKAKKLGYFDDKADQNTKTLAELLHFDIEDFAEDYFYRQEQLNDKSRVPFVKQPTETGKVALKDIGKTEAIKTSDFAKETDTVEVPIHSLKLSKDVPQFKKGASKKGIVEPLGGRFTRTGTGPIQVWERLNGNLEIISGRHRYDLALRSGEKTVPAQIHKESEGFTADKAKIMDALLNIRENQGSAIDYVDVFKTINMTQKMAEKEGLLARALGRRAFNIADNGTDALLSQLRNNKIKETVADEIATLAPKNEELQGLAVDLIVNQNIRPETAYDTVKAVKLIAKEKDLPTENLDLFGHDDSLAKEASKIAKQVGSIKAEINSRLYALRGASKKPELAKQEGIDVKNPEAVEGRIQELNVLKESWDNWQTNPALIEQLKSKELAASQPPKTKVEEKPKATPKKTVKKTDTKKVTNKVSAKESSHQKFEAESLIDEIVDWQKFESPENAHLAEEISKKAEDNYKKAYSKEAVSYNIEDLKAEFKKLKDKYSSKKSKVEPTSEQDEAYKKAEEALKKKLSKMLKQNPLDLD